MARRDVTRTAFRGFFFGKPEKNTFLGSTRHRLDYNIKIDDKVI
jgi:hypothetical protein